MGWTLTKQTKNPDDYFTSTWTLTLEGATRNIEVAHITRTDPDTNRKGDYMVFASRDGRSDCGHKTLASAVEFAKSNY